MDSWPSWQSTNTWINNINGSYRTTSGTGLEARSRSHTLPESRTSPPSRHLYSMGGKERGNSKGMPYRVVIMGATGVGKTALTVRLITRRFIGEYCPTLENVYSHHCTVDEDDVALELLDTAGQAENHVTDYYATWGDCYVWLYSITDRQSLDKLSTLHDQWLQQRRHQGARVHVLLGNKTDLSHVRRVTPQEGQALANTWGCPFHEISVAEGDHMRVITDIFKGLVRQGKRLGLLTPVDIHPKKSTPSSPSSQAVGKFRHAIQKVMLGSRLTMSPRISKKNVTSS